MLAEAPTLTEQSSAKTEQQERISLCESTSAAGGAWIVIVALVYHQTIQLPSDGEPYKDELSAVYHREIIQVRPSGPNGRRWQSVAYQ